MIKKILRYFFNTVVMLPYYSILNNKISNNLNPLVDEILSSKKNINRILINNFEYQTFDITAIYKALKKNLNDRNIAVDYLEFELIEFEKYIKTYENNFENSYEKSLKKVKNDCKKYKIKEIFFPLIDTIHKNYFKIWKDEFKPNFVVKKNLYKEINLFKKKSYNLAKRFDFIILPDTAYLYNHILKQEFLKQNKKVFSLGPHNYFEYKNIFLSENTPIYEKKNLKLFENKKKRIEKFLNDRFKGDRNHGFKSISFRNKKSKNLDLKNKKILYLHSFTDANNNSWNHNQIFFSHTHWTDFTLKELSKSKFKNWYIKLHPAGMVTKNSKFKKNSQFYGNYQIQKYFFNKYKIPKKIIDDCPNNHEILNNKIPVYTNSSTVILETLCYGYKSFFTGPRFDGNYGIKAKSKEEWRKLLNKKVFKNFSKVKKDQLIQAKYEIWRKYSNERISKFAPDIHIYAWDSRYMRLKLAIKYFKKMMNI